MLDQMVFSGVRHKQKKYDALLPQIEILISKKNDLTTNLSHIVKLLHKHLGVNWTGFYQISEEKFILGPYQGEGECRHLPLDKGACGLAYQEERSVVVEDVEQFVGHISCESEYKSELVLPLFKKGEIALLFNAKSNEFGYFDKVDEKNLSIVMHLIEAVL